MTVQALSLELNLFCIAILILILVRTLQRKDRQVSQLKFRNMVIWHIAALSINAIFPQWGAAVRQPELQAQVTLGGLILYYIFLNLAIRSWFVFLGYSMRLSDGFLKRNLTFINISTAVLVLLNATSGWTRLFYYLDGGRCVNTVWMRAQICYLFGIQLIAAVMATLGARRYMSYSDRKKIRLIATYPVIPFIFMFARYFTGSLPYLAISNTMAILIIYVGYLDQLISLDPLTGINNRDRLYDHIAARMEGKEENLCVLMADLDQFKEINDTYGHIEGDRALQAAAEGLRRAVGQAGRSTFLARYGGDEFIVAADLDQAGADDLMRSIRSEIGAAGDRNRLPFELKVSIGLVWYDPETMPTPASLIDAADRSLYRAKERRSGVIEFES